MKPIKKSHASAIYNNEVHDRVASRRAASGRPPLMSVAEIHNFANPETRVLAEAAWLKYDGIDNAANILYSFFTGFVYTPGQTS